MLLIKLNLLLVNKKFYWTWKIYIALWQCVELYYSVQYLGSLNTLIRHNYDKRQKLFYGKFFFSTKYSLWKLNWNLQWVDFKYNLSESICEGIVCLPFASVWLWCLLIFLHANALDRLPVWDVPHAKASVTAGTLLFTSLALPTSSTSLSLTLLEFCSYIKKILDLNIVGFM